jgi:hypothetical protein
MAADFLALDPVAHREGVEIYEALRSARIVRSRDREIRWRRDCDRCRTNLFRRVRLPRGPGVYIIFASHGGVKRSKLTPAAPAASVYMLSC